MSLEIHLSNQFKKDYELIVKSGFDIPKLESTVNLIVTGNPLPKRYKEHKLKGKLSGLWECHIENDWLLIYDKNYSDLIVTFLATGTHDHVFKKK